jgi:hypothetical protein
MSTNWRLPHYEVDHEWGYGIAFKLVAAQPLDPSKLEDMTRDLMKEIADECVKQGATMIGHVKCIMHTAGGWVKADTIGAKYGVYVKSELANPQSEGTLVINSIIVGLDKNKIIDITKTLGKAIPERYGFTATALDKKGMT